MTINKPVVNLNSTILKGAAYFHIERAAALLGCSPRDLLHLGAIGKAEVMGPVLFESTYVWPVSVSGDAYASNEPGFSVWLGVKDRVVLLAEDLARIEAYGSAKPTMFFYPEKAQEIANKWQGGPVPEKFPEFMYEKIQLMKSYPPRGFDWEAEGKGLDDSSKNRVIANAILVPWSIEVPPTPDELEGVRATVDNLFLSKVEVERLASGTPQSNEVKRRKDVTAEDFRPVHGNAQRFSSVREQILHAAISCLFDEMDIDQSGESWAKLIEKRSNSFWRPPEPPMAFSGIVSLLNDAKRFPDQPLWDGKKEKN